MSKNQKNGLFLKKTKKIFKVQKVPDPILHVLIGQTPDLKIFVITSDLIGPYRGYIINISVTLFLTLIRSETLLKPR
jgi:hypothetical protein